MKIFIAKDAGYCFGVRDAVNMAYDTADQNGDVYMLGTIVHNERVIENLDKAGAKVVDKIDEVPETGKLCFLGLMVLRQNFGRKLEIKI